MDKHIKVIGDCPHAHCEGKKIKESTAFKVNPYPPPQQIIGPGAKQQLVEKIEIKVYCDKCLTLFYK